MILQKIALFDIGGRNFAANLETVSELMEPLEYTSAIPAHPILLGTSIYRGGILPVADLSSLFFGKVLLPKVPMWLVFKVTQQGQEGRVALRIDGAAHWKDILPSEFMTLGNLGNHQAMAASLGIYKTATGAQVPILDFAALLAKYLSDKIDAELAASA